MDDLYIGLMSGTSMDGIDAVLIDAEKNTLIHGITHPYTDVLQDTLKAFNATQKQDLNTLLSLNHSLGEAFSEAVNTLLKVSQYPHTAIRAIGSHGQTIFHNPNAAIPSTLQLACPHTISEKTGITVVADFRSRDLVLGGEGAPLAPYYHQVLFKDENLPIAVVNIGGISNLSILHPNQAPSGFDVGPGNVLMDTWIKHTKQRDYDENGQFAASGELKPALLEKLLSDPYFEKKPPKSIDKAYYSLGWLMQYLYTNEKPEDVQCTLTHFTAQAIANTVNTYAKDCKHLFICGGGAQNHALIQALSDALPTHRIETTHALAVDPNYLEAMMFGWLAKQTLQNHPLDLTQITGAKKPAILGAIYPASR